MKENEKLIAVSIVLLLVAITGISQGWIKLSGVNTPIPYTPGTPGVQASAYCAGTGSMQTISSGASLGTAGCYTSSQKVNVALNDFYGSGSLKVSAYQCNYWVYGTQAGTTGWYLAESQSAGSTKPTTCSSGNSYPVGTPMAVEVCEDTSACTSSDFTAQKLEVTCWLPVAGGSLCNPVTSASVPSGPNGILPFAQASSQTGSVTSTFTLSVVRVMGDADTSPTTLYNSANPNLIQLAWGNSTTFSSQGTATGFIKNCTAGKQCNAVNPTANAAGAAAGFAVTINEFLGSGSTTQPTPVPWGAGYMTFYPLNPALQIGLASRGTLQHTLTVQVSSGASAGTGCSITGGLLIGGQTIQPTVFTASSTNQYYLFPLPDSVETQYSTGSIYSAGGFQSNLGLNCAPVFTTSQTVTIGINDYTFFSVKYFQALFGANNPEAVVTAQTTGTTNSVVAEAGFLIKQ